MIRPFEEKDAERCSQIVEYCLKIAEDLPEDAKEFLKNKNSIEGIKKKARRYDLFVLEEDGEIYGMGGLEENKIKSLYVDPEYHKRGYGRQMVKFLEENAKEKNNKKLVLSSSLHAEKFYERNGFKSKGRILCKQGNVEYDNILMEKEL